MDDQNCPLKPHISDIEKSSQNLVLSLRRVRKAFAGCPDCSDYDQCPLLDDFRVRVDMAITEVQAEWNLASS